MYTPLIPEVKEPFWERQWFLWLAMLGFALLYWFQRSPYVGFSDGLSFLQSASHGFDTATNATSHFLYNNILHVLLLAFPFIPQVEVLTAFSVVCSLFTLIVIYHAARQLTPSQGVAMLPVAAIGVSFTFWQQSEVIEVYAFNNLVFAAFAFVTIKDLRQNNRRNYLIASILLGIGLLTHIQHVLAIPFFLGYLFWRNRLSPVQKVLGMVPWMALMSILFVLPAVTHQNTWQSVFFEPKFQSALLGINLMTLGKGLLLGIAILVYNFQLTLILIGRGWVRMWRAEPALATWMGLLGLPYLLFALKYSVNDGHVFYLCFYIVMALSLTYSIEHTPKVMGRLPLLLPAVTLLPVLLYVGATFIGKELPALKDYDKEKAYKGGVTHLLWPGKLAAKDPLHLASSIYEANPNIGASEMPEWNYPAAIQYLIEQNLVEPVRTVKFEF